jgi:hypothetical protein
MAREVVFMNIRAVLVLILIVFVSGCATCAKDPVFERDRNPTDPLTALDRCTEQVLW